MNLQLWSIYYDPEPTGIAPVSTALASALNTRGWHVEVVAAHPHYPEPRWGRKRLPGREVRDGIRVTRVPLWLGRETAAARVRQELSFGASMLAASPFLGRPLLPRPDLILAASPSFPALLPALINSGVRRVPLVLWLHDLLPDGATSTGLVDEGGAMHKAARWLERTAYERSDHIVVLSAPFRDHLLAKGVPPSKIDLIYHPATRTPPDQPPAAHQPGAAPRILSMGNIGLTQGLAPLVAAFEQSDRMRDLDARLVITGQGVAFREVQREVRSPRVEMAGLVDSARLEHELRTATLALVSQSYDGTEFNLPSKLMNFMAYGLPVLAAVNPRSEVARIVREAEAGWVVDSSDPAAFPAAVAAAHADAEELSARAQAARAYADRHFSLDAFGDRFDALLRRFAPTGAASAGARQRADRA